MFNKVKNAYQEAMQMIGNFKANNPDDIKQFLASKGMGGSWIDKALKMGIPMAKMAKTFGPKEIKSLLKDVDIDKAADTMKDICYGVRENKSNYVASYDRRNSDVYHRAGSLPD